MRVSTAISVVVHVVLLTTCVVLAGVRQFPPTTAEAIVVDLVKPDEAPDPSVEPKKQPEPPPQLPEMSETAEKLPPQDSAAQAAAPPAPSASSATTPPAPAPAATPSASGTLSPLDRAVVEPDITEKFGMMFTIPNGASGEAFDDSASEKAKIAREDIAALRAHLKTCSSLPRSVSRADNVKIVLRVSLLPNGGLAADPLLIEASASRAGPALMQSAMAALTKCEPYAMLPADKYKEWRLLDLSFTPADFQGG